MLKIPILGGIIRRKVLSGLGLPVGGLLMLRESHTAVVGRNEIWEGSAASEPYEAGWALEAIVWLRVLAVKGPTANVEARGQLSPDGFHWVGELSLIHTSEPTQPD